MINGLTKRDLFICRLAELAEDGSLPARFNEDDFLSVTKGITGPAAALAYLYELEYNRYLEDPGSNGNFVVRASLLDRAEELREKSAEPTATGFDDKSAQSDGLGDSWEPLPIDRNTTDYELAVASCEKAEKVIREDNGFAASEPETRDHVVWALSAGINALREGLITKQQVVSLLLSPLKFVSSHFTQGVIHEVARNAYSSVVKMLISLTT